MAKDNLDELLAKGKELETGLKDKGGDGSSSSGGKKPSSPPRQEKQPKEPRSEPNKDNVFIVPNRNKGKGRERFLELLELNDFFELGSRRSVAVDSQLADAIIDAAKFSGVTLQELVNSILFRWLMENSAELKKIMKESRGENDVLSNI